MVLLIAEDDPLIRTMLEAYFTNEGYKVIATKDGREALINVDQHSPDVVITDIMMPFYSGLEVTSKIKSSIHKNSFVIVLSAMSQASAKKDAFDFGADEYVTKPFSFSELSFRINRLIKNNHVENKYRGATNVLE